MRLIFFSLIFILFQKSFLAYGQYTITLRDALKTAKINNPELKSQFLNIGISESDLITARLRPNPLLNNQSLQLMRSNNFAPTTNWNDSRNRQTWWQFTKPFQWPGQRNLKIQNANYQIKLTNSEYQEAERVIFSDVANKWLDVWTAQKKLDILLLAQRNIDSLYEINLYRFKKEAITETDLLRTQLLSKQFTIQIATAKQSLEVERRNLRFLLGTNDSIQIDTSDRFNYLILPTLDSLIQQAAKTRNDIVVAQNEIELSQNSITLQRRLAYPVPELGVIYNPQNSIPYAGIFATAEIPIFSRNQGEIQKSHMYKAQAERNYVMLHSLIETEITNAYRSLKTQQRNIEQFQSILTQSQKVLDNVRYSYLRGGTNIIDFLEAQRSWLDTRQEYYDALDMYKSSYIDLLFTTGLISQLAI